MGQTILGERPDDYASDAWLNRPDCDICIAVDGSAVAERYLATLTGK